MATKKKAAPPAAPKTLGALVDELWEQRERKRQLNEHLKTIDAEIETISSELIERMETEGLDKASGKAASISVAASVQPNITDWDTLLPWLIKTKNTHLIQRRISPDPWRELMENKGGRPDSVPGTVAFVKKTLNLRTLSAK